MKFSNDRLEKIILCKTYDGEGNMAGFFRKSLHHMFTNKQLGNFSRTI